MNKLIEEQERLEKGINECECENTTSFAQLELGRCNFCDVMFAKHEGIRFAEEEVIKLIDAHLEYWGKESDDVISLGIKAELERLKECVLGGDKE